MNYNFNKVGKNHVRTNNFIMPMEGQEPLKTILCLPSGQCLDLKEMLSKGIINNKTFVVAVERESQNAKRIESFLSKNFKHHYLHCGKLYTLTRDIENVMNGKKFNMVYLDFCGNLTFEIKAWIFKNHHYFADNCRFCITLKTINRKKNCENITKMRYAKKVCNEVELRMMGAKSHFSLGMWGRTWDKQRQNVITSINYNIADLFVSLDKRDFVIKQAITYKDTTEMIFIDLVLNGEKSSTKALFNSALLTYCNKVEKQSRYKVECALGVKTDWSTKKRGRRKAPKTPKKTHLEMCGVKNRKDFNSPGRQMIVTKYIKKYAKENNLPITEASKRIKGGMNRQMTCMGL